MKKAANSVYGIELLTQWEGFLNDGDEKMFRELYLHYHHYLTFISLKKGFSTSRTKEALSELFLHVWEKREKLAHIKNHHNYLITVFLRKLYKREKTIPEYVELDVFVEFDLCPSVEFEYIKKKSQEDLSHVLQIFIDQLPQKQKLLIYQKFYLGLSYHEIADANKISINTVYNTIYTAVDKLKNLTTKEQESMLSLAFSVFTLLFLFFFLKQ